MKAKEINGISQAFASSKRIMILEILSREPMGYTYIVALVKHKYNIPIASTEFYKSMKILVKHGYVKQKGKLWCVTRKGMEAVRMMRKVVKESDELPKIEMRF